MVSLRTKFNSLKETAKAGMKNEKGLTMIELMFVLLVVAVIIGAIIFAGNVGLNKARETGVLNDMKTFSNASELYLTQESGKDLTEGGLNDELDANSEVTSGVSALNDPWKAGYAVTFGEDTTKGSFVKVASTGKEGKETFVSAVYYKDGKTARCVAGFKRGNTSTVEKVFGTDAVATPWKCGDELK